MKYDKVIRVVAMQRSGHHAVIMWMAEHMEENIHFMNITPGSWKKGIRDIEKLGDHKSENKDVLIFNFEEFDSKKHNELRPCRQGVDETIFIHREPYNLFGSRKKIFDELYNEDQKEKMYGVKAIQLYNKQVENVKNYNTVISYDDWVISEEYRTQLGNKLNLKGNFSDQYSKETKWGGGSSFNDFNPEELSKLISRKDYLSPQDIKLIDDNIKPIDIKSII